VLTAVDLHGRERVALAAGRPFGGETWRALRAAAQARYRE
jgi:hypothetical protein